MATTHNNKHGASATCDTAQVDRAPRFQEDITSMLAYIFLVIFLVEFENIFMEKSLSENDWNI